MNQGAGRVLLRNQLRSSGHIGWLVIRTKGGLMSDWGRNGWAVRPGEGERVEQDPHWLEVLVRGTDVDAALGAFVFTHERIEENAPHVHLGFAKILYILEGQYSFRVGDATFSGGPGTFVFVPKASYHAFTTSTGGRILFVCSPSGNEEMFLEMGKLGPEASEDQLAEVRQRFGMVGLPGENGAPWKPDHS